MWHWQHATGEVTDEITLLSLYKDYRKKDNFNRSIAMSLVRATIRDGFRERGAPGHLSVWGPAQV